MASKSRKKPPTGKREEYRKMEAILGISAFILIVNLLIFAARSEDNAKQYLIEAGAALFISLSIICEKSNRNHDWSYIITMSMLALIPAPLFRILSGYYSFAWVFAAELLIFGLLAFLLLKKPRKKKR